MDEKNIVVEAQEVVTEEVSIKEENYTVSANETVEYIDVSSDAPIVVDTQEAFPPLGEDNSNLNHARLHGRDTINQHPIIAIEGLREELDSIEALKKVYADAKHHADYYMWWDENAENAESHDEKAREGYFVAVYNDHEKIKQEHIKICTTDDDVFGVTVSTAGFIGDQDDIARDYKYGLVQYTGIAPVKCETNVVSGDYVTSNNYGMASKIKDGHDYGYYVSAISEIDGVRYAIVSLATPSTKIEALAETSVNLKGRMTNAEANIAAATNIANAAYDKANSIEIVVGEINNDLTGKVDGVVDLVGGFEIEFDNLRGQIEVSNQTATVAQVTADGAVSTAETVRTEMHDTSVELLTKVGDIEENVATFKTEVTENYVSNEMLAGFSNEVTTNIALIEQKADDNGAMIRTFVANVDNYIVAATSPRYNLTAEEAKSILKDGHIYIPTESHAETYDVYANQEEFEYEFTKGRYYTWDYSDAYPDGIWNEITSDAVVFSVDGTEYFIGGDNIPYWVVLNNDIVHENRTYMADVLYKWVDNEWVPVATINNSVKMSLLQQETDRLGLSVSSLSGSIAAIDLKVTDQESQINTIVNHVIGGNLTRLESWDDLSELDRDVDIIYYAKDTGLYHYYGDTNNDGVADTWLETEKSYEAGLEGTMATTEQKADDNGASIALVVQGVGDNKQINAASIVTAINNQTGESAITLDADKINFVSKEFSIFPTDGAGKIVSDTANFHVDEYGNTYVAGRISATSGYIGDGTSGFTIARSGNGKLEHGVAEEGLVAEEYYVTDGEYYYVFTTTDVIEGDSVISVDISDNGSCTIFDATGNELFTLDVTKQTTLPTHANYLYSYSTGANYYLANGQESVVGDGSYTAGVFISPDGIGLGEGRFYVTSDGYLYANNADIEGKITATSGGIGGFTIADGAITSAGIVISPTEGIKLGSTFSVTADGVLSATDGLFTGTVDGSTITGGTINGTMVSGVSGSFDYFEASNNALYIYGNEVAYKNGNINIGFVPSVNNGITYNEIAIYPAGDSDGYYGNIGTSTRWWDLLYVRNVNCSTINGVAPGDLSGVAKFG